MRSSIRTVLSASVASVAYLVRNNKILPSGFHKLKRTVYKFQCCLIIVSAIAAFSCKKSSPTGPAPYVDLTAVHSTCTETWLRLKTSGLQPNSEVIIYQNDQKLFSFVLNSADTTLLIENLLPGKSYSYQMKTPQYNYIQNTSIVNIRTMDTTSNNFYWQTLIVGLPGNSSCSDAFIFSENNIWVVGEFYGKKDNGEEDPICYNLAKWDGSNWSLEKIRTEYHNNFTIAPIYGISMLNNNPIFLNGLPCLYTNTYWKLYHLWEMGILKDDEGALTNMYVRNDREVLFTGDGGVIVLYKDGQWSRIASGTKTNINDICGYYSLFTNQREELCAVSDYWYGIKGKILKILPDNRVDSIPTPDCLLSTAWTKKGYPIYAAGERLLENKGRGWQPINIENSSGYGCINGDDNNIFISGDSGCIAHFNGLSWFVYKLNPSYLYGEIAIKNNLCVIVGTTLNGQGVITIGKQI